MITTDSRPPSSPARSARIAVGRLAACASALLVLALIAAPVVAADSDPTIYPRREGPQLLHADTPLGPIEYVAGRGLRLGKTKLTIGGFATVSAERLEGGPSSGGLDGVNFFLFFDPVPFVHLFAEIEAMHLAEVQSDHEGIRSNPGTKVERLYADFGKSDLLNVRVGKFLTPFGRWNQVLAEPLVWTTSEPLIVEEVFDETVSGAMLFGTVFPRGGALSYSIYGTFLDHIAPDRDPPPADHGAGARLEWTSTGGLSLGASYFASERSQGEWNHLGGLDALLRPHERVELSAEALVGEGTREDGGQWGLYAQGVVEVVPTIYLVGRYERFEPPGRARAVDLVTVGINWVPVYYLRFKVDYQFADHLDELTAPGLRSSFSVLF